MLSITLPVSHQPAVLYRCCVLCLKSLTWCDGSIVQLCSAIAISQGWYWASDVIGLLHVSCSYLCYSSMSGEGVSDQKLYWYLLPALCHSNLLREKGSCASWPWHRQWLVVVWRYVFFVMCLIVSSHGNHFSKLKLGKKIWCCRAGLWRLEQFYSWIYKYIRFFFSVSIGVAFVISSPFVVVYENAIPFMIKLFLSKAILYLDCSIEYVSWFCFNGPFTVKTQMKKKIQRAEVVQLGSGI